MNTIHFHGSRRSGAYLIRGQQIMPYFENSTMNEDISEGVHIYIKTPMPEIISPVCYYDIIDAHQALGWLSVHKEVGVIVLSKMAATYVRAWLSYNSITLIPQHHCNIERNIRPDRPVETVGYIGSKSACQIPFSVLEESFRRVGLKFQWKLPYFTRETTCEFYNNLDIQIVYRVYNEIDRAKYLKDALKLFNAGSFGIPTVAIPEPGYDDEYHGAYIPVGTFDELIRKCKQLKEDRTLYQDTATEAMQRAQVHHIDNVIPLYRELLN